MTFEEARAQFPGAGADRVPQRRHVRTDAARRARRRPRGAAAGRRGGTQRPAVLRGGDGACGMLCERGSPTLVAADALQVALTSSTTEGCNIVLKGLGLASADEIVTTSAEHFGLLGALSVSGARIVVVEPEPDAIRAAVTPRTRLLALSQVLWTTGRVLPVRELREETGVPVLVDGAQSVGAIPVDAAGVDFLTISGQKWLCGPDSTGALVVAEPEALRVAWPSYFSQAGYDVDGTFEPRPGAARFEPGLVAGLLARRAPRRARRAARLGLRASSARGGALPLAARPPRRPRDAGAALDARRLPRPGRSQRARRLSQRTGRPRPRDPGNRPRQGVVRLVDVGRRSRAAARGAARMTRIGSCPCGAVRYTITGPVRDVIVCHCDACRAAAGGPWRASAARREDFVLAAPGALVWTKAEVSEHDASRGACRECEAYVIWDAPARDTVSFAADTLDEERRARRRCAHLGAGGRGRARAAAGPLARLTSRTG